MKAATVTQNNRFLPAIIKKNGKTKILPGAFYGEEAALAAAQRKIDRLKDAKLKKKAKKKHPPILIDKSLIKKTYIIYVEVEAVPYYLDSTGDWLKLSECQQFRHFPTYQEAYQAGLNYLKSL